VGCCELRQPEGKEEIEAKSRGRVGGGATTGATRQPAGKQEANGRGGIQDKREGRRQRTRGGGAPRGRETVAAGGTSEALRQPAGGASGVSSSSSASSPPRRDGGTPREIPSDGGGSNVSRVVREFGIGEIRASTIVVVDPLASPPLSPPSDARRALQAAAAPTAKQLRLQQ
jgi:hypothetical protein